MSGRRRAGLSRRELQEKLFQLVDTLPAVRVQNRLMACNDRDLALSLVGAEERQIASVLTKISAGKSTRVAAEIRLEEQRRVEDRYIVISLRTVIESLRGKRVVPGARSYLRPRRSNR